MPVHPRQLRRGRICLAVFPFSPRFPVELAAGGRVRTVEEWARAHRGRPARVVTEARLRPVLLLHDRTRPEHDDVICLRINTVKPALRRDEATWRSIAAGEHRSFVFLPAAVERYRLREDSLIAVSSIGSIGRSAILGPTGGELDPEEMQGVSERLSLLIELDLAPRVATLARELLARAGFRRGDPAG
ncbi:MAG: hypothetical protein IT201_07135 [Thermoleophilia bacterium]|nr:hypothetical protein [Thermoleophilia bacterium]